MLNPSRLSAIFVALVIFSVFGTYVSKVTNISPGILPALIGTLMILAGAGAVGSRIGWKSAVGVLTIGSAFEIVGMLTGVPFGRYRYTDVWWPTVPIGTDHRFPLLLPFAWLMIVGGYSALLRPRLKGGMYWIGVATCAMLFDAPMERVMTRTLNYWVWLEPTPLLDAPWQNAAGWWLTSLGAAVVIDKTIRFEGGKEPATVLAGFAGFVAALAAIDGAFVSAAVLAVVAIGTYALSSRPMAEDQRA